VRFRPANEGHACAQPSVQATGWPQPESPNNAPNHAMDAQSAAGSGTYSALTWRAASWTRCTRELRVDVGEVGLPGAG